MTDEHQHPTRMAYCSYCGGPRWSYILGQSSQRAEEDDSEVWFQEDRFIMQCRGCLTQSFLLKESNSELFDTEHFDGEEHEHLIKRETSFPAVAKRRKPEWFCAFAFELQMDDLENALLELYSAYEADLRILTGIAMRMCFDIAAQTLGVDADVRFVEKIAALEKDGHITPADRERIDTLVNAGNASTHRGFKPNSDDLRNLMNVLEAFIYDSIIAPHRKKKMDAEMKKMAPHVAKKPGDGVRK
ncbi:DUF4145 domain-containing protein [Pseudoroseomonas globiformis]|uniref:DUF4145 domain-containing protein n=1 Tax=Teichococcus globiformis TaxID=2307229 RepID=A0ABV7FYS0_9PROT